MAERNTFDYPGMARNETSYDRQDLADRNQGRTILYVVLALVVLAVIYFAASASWQTTDSSILPPAEMTSPTPPAATPPVDMQPAAPQVEPAPMTPAQPPAALPATPPASPAP